MVLFIRSIKSFHYIPENESEQPILVWNMSVMLLSRQWWEKPVLDILGIRAGHVEEEGGGGGDKIIGGRGSVG